MSMSQGNKYRARDLGWVVLAYYLVLHGTGLLQHNVHLVLGMKTTTALGLGGKDE